MFGDIGGEKSDNLNILKYKPLMDINPVEEKLIVFEAFKGWRYGCNPKAIYEEMLSDSRFKDYTFVWAFKNPALFIPDEIEALRSATIVKRYSVDHLDYLSRAKYWIRNCRIDPNISKKADQIYMQTWHGAPLKRLGLDVDLNGKNTNLNFYKSKILLDAKKSSIILSSSRYCTEKLSSAFGLDVLEKENSIFETGYPRNDILVNHTDEDIRKVKRFYSIPSGKKIILYAPTWRDDKDKENGIREFDLAIDFASLYSQLGNDYVVIYRPHYFIKNSFDFSSYKNFVFDGNLVNDINLLYIISDILVTDYSSVFFDYGILQRKIIFFMYDYDLYANDLRGLYLDLSELPGEVVYNQEDLIKSISKSELDKERLRIFKNKYCTYEDGHSSKRAIETLLSQENKS
ncbi:hypothetical protein BWR19_08400 [Halomonas sp. 1513]|nr:hypothetical protein BWR19_08400 [Halomonas sp. 1513]